MPFSISPRRFFSQGVTEIVEASSAKTVAT
jgi:hypothetical protein